MSDETPEQPADPAQAPPKQRNPWVFCLAPIAAAPALAFILMAAIGATLPEAHTATSTVEVDVAPKRAWAVITDFAKQPEWRPSVKSVERLADEGDRPVWREVYKGGNRMTFVTESAEAPARLVRRIVDDGGPFSGTWTTTIEARAGGSTITIREDGKVGNPVFRFVAKYMIGHTSTMDLYLSQLRRRLDQ